MYRDYYKLSAMPFQLTPDHRFFFASQEHDRAMAHLAYGLAQEEGFIIITGEIGAGKTMLVERLWSQLDQSNYAAVRIQTTHIGGGDLLRLVASGCGLTVPDGDKAAALYQLEQHFAVQRRLGKRFLLVVDEAQNLPIDTLEELRMLSNLTLDGRAPFQAVLLGQPQFRRMLTSKRLEQLGQRVLASYHLGPLNDAETRAYIEHRLTTAGWTGRPSFDDAAYTAIHRHAGGIPRRINTLCSRLLLAGALDQTVQITQAMADEVAEELRQDLAAPSTVRRGASRPAPVGEEPDVVSARLGRVEARLKRHDRIIKSAIEIGLQLLEAKQ